VGLVVSVRVHIASDVHGAVDSIARAAEGSDVFVCLGDLILFLDYDDPENGIYADLFGVDYARSYIELRTANRFEEAREFSAAAWKGIGVTTPEQRWETLEAKVHEQYARMFAAIPSPAFLTYGNVDVPQLWQEYLRPGHTVLDGQVVEVDGQRWGFLGGGLVSPMRTPYELEPDVYSRKLMDMGPVDVLFTHIPPRHELLNYDVVARRFEVGSSAITEYIAKFQPRYHFFGHVHQPLVPRLRMGTTESVNVGHFHGKEKPFVIDL
jgi:Icc-related predicted phosphoesterase